MACVWMNGALRYQKNNVMHQRRNTIVVEIDAVPNQV